MRSVVQPGHALAERQEILPVSARPVDLRLRPQIPLEEAVAEAMAEVECDGGWFEFRDAGVSALDYVIPALSPDEEHAAWYSGIVSFGGPGRIQHLGFMVGKDGGVSFVHGHGLWAPEGGPTAMGHVLAPRTVLAEPVIARGIGVTSAWFERRPDPETNFTLFRPAGDAPASATADNALVRLAPNQDFPTALDQICGRLGWEAARVHGIGSLIDARFEDGTVLDSLATEFLVLDAEARAGGGARPGPEIVILGVDGADIRRGTLSRGDNPVLITAELIFARR